MPENLQESLNIAQFFFLVNGHYTEFKGLALALVGFRLVVFEIEREFGRHKED